MGQPSFGYAFLLLAAVLLVMALRDLFTGRAFVCYEPFKLRPRPIYVTREESSTGFNSTVGMKLCGAACAVGVFLIGWFADAL